MKAMIKRAGEKIQFALIEEDLHALQTIVDGLIEILPIGEGILLICNENGKIDALQPNFRLGSDIICGDVVFVGEDGENLCSLTDKQIKYLKEVFGC